ncbi:ATP-dependent DNA helicase RecG [Paraconexibacter antarcticus]|uniref:Probable DNA 3'-5' helicase RecG n=1 Tax=Paraconexibacter antarcticus TaxID=2949664 RepID=A0ABY5DMA4_9ACTN|nr:ATP-dependent DNA helicase RecG [Paraconexibacter antarcticus]UTI63111.1 ATP-dependent DNA helicase RecG [Paraconexibacter antarcticus]
MPTHFADPAALSDADLRGAPVRYPRPSALEEPLTWAIPTVAEAAELLGLHTVGDLLRHLPRDSGEGRLIEELVEGEVATVVVEVRRITSRPVRRRGMKPLVQAIVVDGSGVMEATFFNQPWLHRQYVPGTRLVLAGKYQGGNRFRVNSHAVTDQLVATGAAVAQYPATKGITSTQILAAVQAQRAHIHDVVDPLPLALRRAEALPDRVAALGAAHFSDHEEGRRRLAFDELLLDQIVQLRLRAQRRGAHAAVPLDAAPAVSAHWRRELLPFTPTGDQLRAMDEVDRDLARDRPMQRLLMGEVGSGKTVVALHAMLRAVDAGRQATLMAPTETLAEQHFATLSALLPGLADDGLLATAGLGPHPPVRGALLTGSTTTARRRALLARLASGELDLLVGTHALIEPDVAFADLALAVVDEQHRFGVRQRSALDAKARAGHLPHVLHMTATPIPRTLRLASFGALDVTALRELPKGRRPIATHVVSGEQGRARAYDRLREELLAGRQAFVVCPLVSESEALAARAATAEYERLQAGELVDFEVVLMHGQMKSREKAETMARFAAGEADVLVATTVIEVGIDVPNATVMIVEDAERYGISQLHQLRGRVGRGEHASLCLLFGPADSRRLQALAEHTDGFRLAEIDLELRGEGEITGTRQSGMARHRFARLPEDGELLARAHDRAQLLLDADPALADPDHALLAAELAELESDPVAA